MKDLLLEKCLSQVSPDAVGSMRSILFERRSIYIATYIVDPQKIDPVVKKWLEKEKNWRES